MQKDELYLRMNDSPQAVLVRMKEMETEVRRAEQRRKLQRVAGILLIIGGGLAFYLSNWAGFPQMLGFAFLLLGVFGGLWLTRRSKPYALCQRFEVTQEILSALQDDAERVAGLLDLTRPDDDSKKVRTARSGGGKQEAYYRNPWLQLKLTLVDGNLLRLSLVGKLKTKAGSVVRRDTKITVKLAINTDLYRRSEVPPKGRLIRNRVYSSPDDVLLVRGEFDTQTLSVERLLSTIELLYSQLEPVGQALVPGS